MRARSKARPQPPEGLSEEATLEFHRVCDALDDAGRLGSADQSHLTLYAQTWDVHQRAMAQVAADGPVTTYSNGMKGPSPYWKVAREAATQLRRLMNDLGLTPASGGGGTGRDTGDAEPLEV
jgi:P27 family predicted phage terminase small subunit